MADALDSKSSSQKECGFDSHRPHHSGGPPVSGSFSSIPSGAASSDCTSTWRWCMARIDGAGRCWRKLHLGVDADGFIVASELTDSGMDDGSVGAAMIRGYDGSIERFTGDGAYDTRAIYEALAAGGGGPVTRPRGGRIRPSVESCNNAPPQRPWTRRSVRKGRCSGFAWT